VESLAEAMERGLRGSYGASGMSVSARFSPGYCDWPVSGQSALDGALGFSKAGVALTESLMMTPRKSISGLVAVGPKGLFSSAVSQCDFCGEKTCDFRRKQ
jgi:cobalamin-dependent methionine synthase I